MDKSEAVHLEEAHPYETGSSHNSELKDGSPYKHGMVHVENHVPFTAAEDRALIRKIDLRTIPWLSFLYLLAFLDRANVGNAKLEGLLNAPAKGGLGISDQQYLWGLTIFFISYAIFEVPSNILLKRLKPHIWFPIIIFLWGVNMTLMGLMKNYNDLLAARFFLGVFEAGLFPGVNYYLSSWYKRSEFGVRAAIFFSAATVAGAFGGLLAAGIAQMSGAGGKLGWAWIFILEGLLTVVAAIASFWIIVDFPDTASFLTERERAQVVWRLQQDAQKSAAGEGFEWKRLLEAFSDIKVWLAMIVYMGADGALYAFSLFVPTIIKELGYTNTRAQLFTVPPYVCAAVTTVSVGVLADRYGKRGMWNIICSSVAIAGYAMLRSTGNAHISYAGVFLAAMGVYPMIPNTVAWFSNNFEGAYKRGIALAIFISWGNLNGAVSSNIYRARDKPRYKLGHEIVLMYLCFAFLGSAISLIYLRAENAKRRSGRRDYRVTNKTEKEILDLGDLHPEYIYRY
ncbi:putative MFS transporter [Taphrina deformans PYCC 5710]|uniref:MFS transporter n=1 Tax=Taphrina deformans (strain PYCC 5710 / ATCC 11124 / CBS 356.35 / IMI 108563 / JCM 9778 / NBRC 8474) TaxID=1097556 RepID=R4X6X8_TAPDE|nr:putative MFS transporter [Taphrina deformans PYCC 5710]|eukprot:CCG80981.1 putative MFS transporter [Taphrina deformans PYCC 5710]